MSLMDTADNLGFILWPQKLYYSVLQVIKKRLHMLFLASEMFLMCPTGAISAQKVSEDIKREII